MTDPTCCPECGARFTPRWTATEFSGGQLRCSTRCSARVSARRRHARRAGAPAGDWIGRYEVLRERGATCGICDEPFPIGVAKTDPGALEVDHVVPVAGGGEHTYANVQPAHLACNRSKQ